MQQMFALGADQARSKFEVVCQMFLRRIEPPSAQLPGKEEGRRNSEHEQVHGRNSQQLVPPAPGGVNQDAPARSLELDFPRVRGVPGESGGAGNSGAESERKRLIQIAESHPGGLVN